MTELTQRTPVAGSLPRPALPTRSMRVQLLAAVVGLIGAAAIGYGVVTPWLSTYAGLLSQSGWGTRNGNILFVLAVVAACLALLQLVRATSVLRWMLALTGFAAAGFAGYLLIQLYSVTQQLDGMALASKGPGLYVAAAGGALVFATIFLPLPQREPVRSHAAQYDAPYDALSPAAPAPASTGTLASVLQPLGSRLRFPTAVLGIIAALVHVPVTPAHLQEARYIGVLFMVFTTVCLLAVTLLVINDNVATWTVLGGSCLLAVVAFVISRTVGLPLMADDIGNWSESMGVIALVSESAVVILAAFAIAGRRRLRDKRV
jgi:hypothetical protein